MAQKVVACLAGLAVAFGDEPITILASAGVTASGEAGAAPAG